MITPIISLIMSVHNGEMFLPDCIEGINRQTFSDYEVIVVDDGSTDGTLNLLSEWKKENDRVRLIRKEHEGLTSALNLAVSHAKGRYLARHDADDISSPHRLKQQYQFLEKYTEAVVAGSHWVDITDSGLPIALYCLPDNPEFIIDILHNGSNPLVHGSVLIRKTAFERLAEGYRFRYCQDFDLYLRLRFLGELRIVPEILYALRNNPSRTAIRSRFLKHKIITLIRQVHGLRPWDRKSTRLMADYNGTKPLWQILQEHILQHNPDEPENKIKARYFMSLIGDNFERNRGLASFTYAIKAIAVFPGWGKVWLALPYAVIGSVLPASLRNIWRGRSLFAKYKKSCDAVILEEIFSPNA